MCTFCFKILAKVVFAQFRFTTYDGKTRTFSFDKIEIVSSLKYSMK